MNKKEFITVIIVKKRNECEFLVKLEGFIYLSCSFAYFSTHFFLASKPEQKHQILGKSFRIRLVLMYVKRDARRERERERDSIYERSLLKITMQDLNI